MKKKFYSNGLVIASMVSLILIFFGESSAQEAPAQLTTINYVFAIVAGIIGNTIHFFKKNIKGESDSARLEYLKNHKIRFGLGILIAICVIIGESQTILKSGEGLMWTAFLTGYSADSIFGKYTEKK